GTCVRAGQRVALQPRRKDDDQRRAERRGQRAERHKEKEVASRDVDHGRREMNGPYSSPTVVMPARVARVAGIHVFITCLSVVMPALVAGIHVFLSFQQVSKTWMAGTSPAMTFL